MKTLVVDDELVSRSKMEKIMSTFGDCLGVESASQALSAFKDALGEESPFDLVTLDVSMPEMDGTQVLVEMRDMERHRGILKENRSKIIMVTAHTDKDTVITCIRAGCDDYVVKPFDKGIMARKFEKLGLAVPDGPGDEMPARWLVMDTVEKFKQGRIEVPVLPQIVQEVLTTAEDPLGDAENLASIVEKDGAISIKLITTANSPVFRATEKIQDVATAVARLGRGNVRQIVSALASKSLFETKNKNLDGLMKKLWLHSLACAYAAQTVTSLVQTISKTPVAISEQKAFLMGLVHDIGCALLLKGLTEDRLPRNGLFELDDLLVVLQEVHTFFGATLLETWGFSRDFVKIARLHEWTKFTSDTEKELLIVNLADRLTHRIGFGFFDIAGIETPDLDSATLLKLDPAQLEDVCEKTKTHMENALSLFQ